MSGKKVYKSSYDVVVVGGGLSGLLAAIASARHGAKTVLIQNRPVLGGNASSEVRMHICGADCSGHRPHARETGIVEEICLEHKNWNIYHNYSKWDAILWEKAKFQDNLDTHLNTHFTQVVMDGQKIKKVIAEQLTTEKIFEIEGKIFIEATGDGTLGYLAGADYVTGREGKDVYDEPSAPDESDQITMGNTLMFKAVDMGEPVSFRKPEWAHTYNEEDLKTREHHEISSGFWWIEYGGVSLDTITDSEEIRDELTKIVYGIWDHIKNGGDHGAENYELDWVQTLPGKRENRRFLGDYMLIEKDLVSGRRFDDAVAYGGWPIDIHVVGGMDAKTTAPVKFTRLDDVYTIPYRCLYSRNIENLFLAGRSISTSRVVHGSTRDMGTTAVIGQATGTAAAIAVEKRMLPRQMNECVKQLQQKLLKDDCYIPGIINEDEDDLARNASVSCSSFVEKGECENVINGVQRMVKDFNTGAKPDPDIDLTQTTPWAFYHTDKEDITNCWISDKISADGEWIELDFGKEIQPEEVRLYFDSNLSKVINITIREINFAKQYKSTPPELVKDYTISLYNKGECVYTEKTENNYLRFKKHDLPANIKCDKIRMNVLSTNGDEHARLFEVRVY